MCHLVFESPIKCMHIVYDNNWEVYPIACVHGTKRNTYLMKSMYHEEITMCSFLHTYQTMQVAHGLDHDASNPPYITLGDAMQTTQQGQRCYMMLELKSSYHYLTGDLGNKCPRCELGFFSLNLHLLGSQASKSPVAILGLQVSFGTHTI